MEPASNPEGASPAERSIQIAPDADQLDLAQFKQRLQALSARVEAIEQLEAAEQLPPEEAAQMLEQLVEMEAIIREGLDGIFSPSVFWQAVRWGGLGVVLGALLQRWVGSGA
ncbi:MAG: hypothetical protein AAGM36_07540 [Cyanobacteria bacterium J06597_1]